MPSQTTDYDLPYPLSTDPVASGAADIQDLAEAVDSRLGADTGWTPLTPANGTGTFHYRVVGSLTGEEEVWLRGSLTGLSVSAGSTQSILAAGTLAAAYRPSTVTAYGTANLGGSNHGQVTVGTDGAMAVLNGTGSTVTVARFFFSYRTG